MPKKFRPLTPSTRHLTLEGRTELTPNRVKRKSGVCVPKALRIARKKTGGRNAHGHITSRHLGGGHKRHYRVIDFKRAKENIPGRVASIDYDPNRSARIALIHYIDGEKQYILAPERLKPGDQIMSGEKAPFSPGCSMRLRSMPLGSFVHNVELVPDRGGKLVRSAGLSAQLMARDAGMATLKMPSGEVRLVNDNCRASFGALSNSEHSLRSEGKAGRNRWRGIRPTVRGTAMNPVDHPHGGGEGKHNGYIPQSPWAMQTKGFRTRKKRKTTKWIVKDRRKK